MTDHERRARVGLSRLLEPRDHAGIAAVLEHGAVAVWSSVLVGDADLVGAAMLDRMRARLVDGDQPDRDLANAAGMGARLLCPGDDEWPARLALLGGGAPLCLWARGPLSLDLVTLRAVAVVGARAATGYGTHVAAELGCGLAEAGWTVVSGAAYGIDGAAHRGALAVDGATVAVLACGVDVPYPRGHDTLLARIAGTGLVLSEWPPGAAPFPLRFLDRNRVIAALCAGTVVVEAAARSGALSTARKAHDLGLEVMAVPGPVTSAMSVGCHQLLRLGAVCVTNAAEVIEVVGEIGADLADLPRGPDDPRDGLDPDQRRVIEAVPVHRAQSAARISGPAGLDVARVRSLLAVLEVAGMVERVAGGYRLSAAERARRRAVAGADAERVTGGRDGAT